MSLKLALTSGPGAGLRFMPEQALMTLDTSLTCTKGDILAVKNGTVDIAGNLNTVRVPATADFTQASGAFAPTYFCVALETQSTAAGPVNCQFTGTVDAALFIATDASATGKWYTATNAARSLTVAASATGGGLRVIAQARAATVAATTSAVDFDGINGFGNMVTNTT